MYWLDEFWSDFRKDQEMYLAVLELADLIENEARMKSKAAALRTMFARKVTPFSTTESRLNNRPSREPKLKRIAPR
jgi:hypothetical protein